MAMHEYKRGRLANGRHLVLAAGLGLGAACGTEENPPPADALRLAPVDSGYTFPLFVTAPPGDASRLLVVELRGKVLLRKNGVRQAAPFLDLSSRLGPGSNHGVLSMAFHPRYSSNRRLFAYYIDGDGNTKVSEFQAASADAADLGSERVILTQAQRPDAAHYGGLIGFGPDGMLYIALGDGDIGGAPIEAAQDSAQLLGKMVRIDVDGASPYEVPPDNPYAGRNGWLSEIWQIGLRNPWRWAFDRETGDLYIADVGENFVEEINLLQAPAPGGKNFGWPFMEGSGCLEPPGVCDPTGLTKPIVEYSHAQDACSVTGGFVYRGEAFPAMRGTYLYSDFCGGWIRSFRLEGGRAVEAYPQVAAPTVGGVPDAAVSFGEDAAGEVYVVFSSGYVYRIEEDQRPIQLRAPASQLAQPAQLTTRSPKYRSSVAR